MREMKDSGVAWMGEIPSDWKMIRFKDKYTNTKEIAKERSKSWNSISVPSSMNMSPAKRRYSYD